MTYAPCPDCGGQLIVGSFSPIVVPRVDDDGFPELGPDGKVKMIRLRLPNHRAVLISTQGPEAAHSVFDPTGLAPAACEHGIAEHPDGWRLRYGAQSWIRSKHLDVGPGGVRCPVCKGEPAPEDLATPRTA